SEKRSSISDVANRAVATRLFGSFPYGNSAEGTVETVARIDRADLMLARERFLNADNATLAVIGGVEKARLMRAARQLLGSRRKRSRTVGSKSSLSRTSCHARNSKRRSGHE